MAAIVKTVKGLVLASNKTFNGLAAASLKTINGQDATSGGVTYLINQNFETPVTGYDNGEAWTSGGTVNPANTSSPIVGLQSCTLSSNFATILSPSFAASADLWVFARITVSGTWHSAGFDQVVFCIRAADDTDLASLSMKSDQFYLNVNGSLSGASATSETSNLAWYIWLHHSSTGNSGVYMNTTGTKPSADGSGAVKIEMAGVSNNATKILVVRTTDGDLKVDHILASTSTIGNNP